MQYDKADRLRALNKKNKNCKHQWEKEYYLGAQTSDYVCRKCGVVITDTEYRKLVDEHKKNL